MFFPYLNYLSLKAKYHNVFVLTTPTGMSIAPAGSFKDRKYKITFTILLVLLVKVSKRPGMDKQTSKLPCALHMKAKTRTMSVTLNLLIIDCELIIMLLCVRSVGKRTPSM